MNARKADRAIDVAKPAARDVTRCGFSIRACGAARRDQVYSVRPASHITFQAVSAGTPNPPVELMRPMGVQCETPGLMHIVDAEPSS